jgi:metal-sulfur cluster biosynthetic enzyme
VDDGAIPRWADKIPPRPGAASKAPRVDGAGARRYGPWPRGAVPRVQLRSAAMVAEADVKKALRKVKDPELNLDLVVLGLIYDIRIDGGKVEVTMSLTSPMCPVAGELLNQAREAVETVPGVESAEVELTFSPPWTADRINPTIRAALGL